MHGFRLKPAVSDLMRRYKFSVEKDRLIAPLIMYF